MASKSLHHITRKRLSEKETRSTMAYARDLDDRGCTIILTALLEHGLEGLLIKKMRRLTTTAHDRLFFGSGPLATFSAKIRIAAAFGVIGPKTTHDLETFNDIRNAFAHSAQRVTFRNMSIRNRLTGLHVFPLAAMWGDVHRYLEDAPPEDKKLYPTTKGKYLLSIGSYLVAFRWVRKKSGAKLGKANRALQN